MCLYWFQLGIYDLNPKSDFSCVYVIQSLDHIPLCLDFWLVLNILTNHLNQSCTIAVIDIEIALFI